MVHKGFQQAYLAVQADVLQWLESRCPRPSEIYLSGHSLGAALATLAAMQLCALERPVVAVVTFGSPPLGSEELAQRYADMGLDRVTVRFANRPDPIPRLKELVGRFCDFKHVVPATWLGKTMTDLWVPTPYSHSMAGNSESYLSTLHDATEGLIQTGRALTMLRDANPYLQQIQVDVALVRRDLARLAEGLVETARELRSYIIHANEWERALDLEAMVDLVLQHPDMLPTWQDARMPEWFMRLHAAKRKVYEACLAGLREQSSKLFQPFLVLFLRAGLVLLKAMEACGALLQDETTSPIQICSLLEAALEGFSIAGIALCRQLWRAAQPHDCVVKFAAKPTARALEFNILKKQEDFADAQEGSLRNTLNIHLFEDMQLTDETLQ
ncbi:mdlA, partial [Symbiodinium microadriaticum]